MPDMTRIIIEPWFETKLDQRLEQLSEVLKHVPKGINICVLQLSDPPEWGNDADYHAWNHTCDKCGEIDFQNFFGGQAVKKLDNGLLVTVVFGLCGTCALPLLQSPN